MKYNIKNGPQIDLNKNNYVTEGGEGRIYIHGSTVYKIYLDPKKMIPEQKINELSVLIKPNIIKPKKIITDRYGKCLGFTMKNVNKSVSLCKLFTTSFRDSNNITNKSTQQLINKMIETIDFIHSKNCLIVDGNEMNYLVDNANHNTPFFIDVDSYQTKSFPATAIMPSIRDWQAKKMSPLSDWFSFAIIACQLYIGIHPYKGRHSGYKRSELEKRMRANISIFNKDVTIPPTVRDFGNIPQEFMKWFIQLFEKGKRLPPPQMAGMLNIVPVTTKIVRSTNNFIIDLMKTYDDNILKYKSYGTSNIVWTKNKLFIDKIDYDFNLSEEIVFSPKMLEPIKVSITHDKLKLYDLKKRKYIEVNLNASDLMVKDNTIYIKNSGKFNQIILTELNDRIFATVKNSWNIMPYSSTIFSGIIYQNILGKAYITIPDPTNNSCYTKAIPELATYRIIDGKYDNNVAIFTLYKGNKYSRCIIVLDKAFDKYIVRFIEDINYSSINFTVLNNGITVFINEDGELQLFSNSIKNNTVKIVHDKSIELNMVLGANCSTVIFYQKNNLNNIKMKNRSENEN